MWNWQLNDSFRDLSVMFMEFGMVFWGMVFFCCLCFWMVFFVVVLFCFVLFSVYDWLLILHEKQKNKKCISMSVVYVSIYRLWVGQRTEPVIVFLSSCIPEAQIDWFAIHHDISWVVVKSVETMERIVNDQIKNMKKNKISSRATSPVIFTV